MIDFNGSGSWSVDEVRRRYEVYVQKYGIRSPRDLRPSVLESPNGRWTYPIMHCVIEGIESGDAACAEIGIEFIEEDASFSFGRILKSNAARALRGIELTEAQKDRIRERVVRMLEVGYLPREYRQYAKLGRKIGLGDRLQRLRQQAPFGNPWAQRYYRYFEDHASD